MTDPTIHRLRMNALERYMAETGADAAALMDWLQGRGIVSDNCLLPRDVHSGDAEEAVRQLRESWGNVDSKDENKAG